MTVRTRFAPSPTGYIHLGGLRTALYTYLLARKNKGVFILRIEDTDQEREVEGAVELIYQSMRLAGLPYDEGPDVGGDFGPYIQSQRKHLYAPKAWELVGRGAAYPCFCTKERLDTARHAASEKGETFKYDKHCLSIPLDEAKRRIGAGEPHVIRQNIPETGKASFDDLLYGHVEVDCATLDDNVLLKADGLPTYNFANVVDDHMMGITHVTRGTEYLSSAPKYNLLYEAFGWEKPLYIHLPVVMKDAARKLSKRHGDPSFQDLLDQGYLPEAIINYIALLGWSPGNDREFFTLKELEETFDVSGLNKSPAIFDMNKLRWMNWEYVRKLPRDEYIEKAMPFYIQAGLDGTQLGQDVSADMGEKMPGAISGIRAFAEAIAPVEALSEVVGRNISVGLSVFVQRLAELTQSRTEVFTQIPEMVSFLAKLPDYDISLFTNKKMKTDPEIAKRALALARPVLAEIDADNFQETVIHDALMDAIRESGMKNGQVLWPLRIAISGKESTPGGAIEIAYLLGKGETLKRVDRAIERLGRE